MHLLFSAAFNTRATVGISAYIRHIVPELARLCELTVLTPDPEVFSDVASTIRIPEYTRSHLGRVLWTSTSLGHFLTHRYDAVFCPTPVVPVYARLPAVAVVHDLTPLMLPKAHSSPLKALFWGALQTLRWARAVITVSENTRRDLARCSRAVPLSRVHVVPEGPGLVPVPGDTSFAHQLQPYLLYVGGHARHKNLPRLVSAFGLIHQRPSLKLVMTGWSKPELIDRTRSAVTALGLQQRVIIMANPLDESQLSSLYRHCTAFVYPSLYEGFGLPVLEALAHGIPVACSRVSSLPEVGGEAAVYFDPTSVRDIAEKLNSIISDEVLERRLRRQGPLRAAEFSWTKAALDTLLVTERAITSRSRR
ncbi:glycosyltransferase family 4 protein [candidate division WOR-3 bacterium]|nr:glycosyltransferase family 4 protein [candidate division WOR-3 bacterium]